MNIVLDNASTNKLDLDFTDLSNTLSQTPKIEVNKTNNFDEVKNADAFARIECHYFTNGGFFETDSWLLENAHRLEKIPGVIIQGRYDVVCPMKSAWELYKEVPHFDFCIVKDSGHSMLEKGIQKKLVEYSDKYISY